MQLQMWTTDKLHIIVLHILQREHLYLVLQFENTATEIYCRSLLSLENILAQQIHPLMPSSATTLGKKATSTKLKACMIGQPQLNHCSVHTCVRTRTCGD